MTEEIKKLVEADVLNDKELALLSSLLTQHIKMLEGLKERKQTTESIQF